MKEHTPGQWRLDGPALVVTDTRDIAKCYQHADGAANARLIAAAPDLYAALKNLFDKDLIRGDIDSDHMNEVIDALSGADWTDR